MKKTNRATSEKESKPALAAIDSIGIDIGDKVSHYCRLDTEGMIAEEQGFYTTITSVKKHFAKIPKARIAMETGGHSNWMRNQLASYGHEVHVCSARDLAVITSCNQKSDRRDAEMLARLARFDVNLLHTVYVRSQEGQRDLAVLRSRDGMVRARTLLVNLARSLAKIEGRRLPSTVSQSFGKRAAGRLPESLRGVLEPMLEQIDALSVGIGELTKRIEQMLRTKYPDGDRLRKIPGVGPITALHFVLTLGSKERFAKSRDVGAYLGMTPKRKQSGERDPQLGISKEGNGTMRHLLVQCAHYMLGKHGEDSALRRWGQKLAARGGANANKRAVIAVARKLSVIMHRLWCKGEEWKPFPAH